MDDPDVQPVKSVHYHFGMKFINFTSLKQSVSDSKDVYNTKIVRHQQDEFQKELSRTIHQISSQDAGDGEDELPENTEDVSEAELSYQQTPRPRPVPLQVLSNIWETS